MSGSTILLALGAAAAAVGGYLWATRRQAAAPLGGGARSAPGAPSPKSLAATASGGLLARLNQRGATGLEAALGGVDPALLEALNRGGSGAVTTILGAGASGPNPAQTAQGLAAQTVGAFGALGQLFGGKPGAGLGAEAGGKGDLLPDVASTTDFTDANTPAGSIVETLNPPPERADLGLDAYAPVTAADMASMNSDAGRFSVAYVNPDGSTIDGGSVSTSVDAQAGTGPPSDWTLPYYDQVPGPVPPPSPVPAYDTSSASTAAPAGVTVDGGSGGSW